MSADPLVGLASQAIDQASAPEEYLLAHHVSLDADFWIDSSSERNLSALTGDIQQTLASAHNSTGLTGVRNDYGFTGAGQTVAVIDSGIAWNHSALGAGLGATYRVVGGWDFAENDANPYDDGPWGSHGTHVAGIIGADAAGTNYDGVATGVDLVGLRVFDDAGAGYFRWVESALRWVHENRNAFANPITAVNLSLGMSWNSDTIPNWAMLEDEFAQLKADGIFIAVSAGNSFSSYKSSGLSYPAVSPHVVPVMSVTDNGGLSSFSQRHTRAIGAPGQYIVSSVPDYVGDNNGVNDDFASYSGTSMAAPYVAGASVLLRQAMQFVGYTNITQDTIYNHMMNTATSFLDAATGQTYKRINLASAFDALMPTDEYGSTAATAHNLGSLSGSSEIGGLIGKLSDADYFSFTAASTGRVTFTATTTHGLVPEWATSGGIVSGSDGETYTLDVVAGQSYMVGLSTGGGIGYYNLAIEAESVFTYVDWGTVTQSQLNDIASAGEAWYCITAGRTGYLTAEALFAAAGGDVDIAIYDGNLQLVANGITNAAGERVDVSATAGTIYFVRVIGTNADVDFRLTNLVSHDSLLVNVAGTSGNDSFIFCVGSTHHTVSVNGISYQFNKANVAAINFAGGAGSDTMIMTGSAAAETATLSQSSTVFLGAGFAASAVEMEDVCVVGGGGSGDRVNFYDSAGDDRFVTKCNVAYMSGAAYYLRATGFTNVYGYATAGGNDISEIYDTPGNDLFRGKPDFSVMTGGGMYRYAQGFEYVYGYSNNGGVDIAELYDSPEDDLFVSHSGYSALRSKVSFNLVRNFEYVYAYSMLGGTDTAHMFDSAGNDLFVGRQDQSIYRGMNFQNTAKNFAKVKAYSCFGGVDTVMMYGSAGDDGFIVSQNECWRTGGSKSVSAHGFASTKIYGMGGSDLVQLDGLGNGDIIFGRDRFAYWYQPQRRVQIEDVEHIAATQVSGATAIIELQSIDYIFELL